MLSRLVLAAAFLTLGSFTGCAAFQPGRSIIKQEKDAPPKVLTAPVTGTYALYALNDVQPKFRVQLNKGDALGFKIDETTGRVGAVAGDQLFPLTGDQTYYWRRL